MVQSFGGRAAARDTTLHRFLRPRIAHPWCAHRGGRRHPPPPVCHQPVGGGRAPCPVLCVHSAGDGRRPGHWHVGGDGPPQPQPECRGLASAADAGAPGHGPAGVAPAKAPAGPDAARARPDARHPAPTKPGPGGRRPRGAPGRLDCGVAQPTADPIARDGGGLWICAGGAHAGAGAGSLHTAPPRTHAGRMASVHAGGHAHQRCGRDGEPPRPADVGAHSRAGRAQRPGTDPAHPGGFSGCVRAAPGGTAGPAPCPPTCGFAAGAAANLVAGHGAARGTEAGGPHGATANRRAWRAD